MAPMHFIFGLACAWAIVVQAALHHLLVPSKLRNSIYALEFNDEAGTISLVKESQTLTNIPSIAVSHSGKFVHASFEYNSSVLVYNLEQDYSLTLNQSASYSLGTGNCGFLAQPVKLRLKSSPFPPYLIYSTISSDSRACLTVNWALEDGIHLSGWRSTESGGWHGDYMALRSDNQSLYVMDNGSLITLRVFNNLDRVVDYNFRESWFPENSPRVVGLVAGPKQFIGIRGSTNELVTMGVSPDGWAPGHDSGDKTRIQLSSTQKFLPDANVTNTTISNWITTSLATSLNRKYLWVASPGAPSNPWNDAGWLTVFAINTTSDELGAKLFQENLDSFNGYPNKDATAEVVAAPFGDEYVAVSTYPAGQVEIWKVEDNGAWLKYVTKWEGDGECCGSLVWID